MRLKLSRLAGAAALAVAASLSAPSTGLAQTPTTITFNWEAAYGRQNILVWPFRPGRRFEQLVTQHTGGTVKLDIKEKLFGIMDSAYAIGDGPGR